MATSCDYLYARCTFYYVFDVSDDIEALASAVLGVIAAVLVAGDGQDVGECVNPDMVKTVK